MSLFDQRRLLLQSCTVRLSATNGHGTGAFVAPGVILTCRHVATQLGVGPDRPIDVSWRTGDKRTPLKAVLGSFAEDDKVDLALLRLWSDARDHEVPDEIAEDDIPDHPCIHMLGNLEFGDETYTYGFPGQTDGDSVGFRYEGESTTDGEFLLKLKMGRADFGLSGSGLLNRRTGSVCGIVSISLDTESSLGARAVPVEAAFLAWPELIEQQQQAHKRDRRWSELLPPSIWTSQEAAQRRNEMDEKLQGRPFLVPSPAASLWHEFTIMPGWHTRMEWLLQTTHSRASLISQLSPVFQHFKSINLNASYEAVREKLRTIVKDDVFERVAAAAREIREKLYEPESLDHKISSEDRKRLSAQSQATRELLQTLLKLRAEIEDPAFDRCFLLVGSIGSGKTHFVTSVFAADPFADRSYLIMALEKHDALSRDISDVLLAKIRTATQEPWDSVEQFDRYLCAQSPPIRLVVVVDDFHEFARLDGMFAPLLRAFIREHTHLHSLYWVITLQDTFYERVSEDRRFWRMYGFPGPERIPTNGSRGEECDESPEEDDGGSSYRPTRIGGWVHLDELNLSQQLGLTIIRTALPNDKWTAQLFKKFKHPDAAVTRYLCNPSLAWMLIDVHRSTPVVTVATLTHIGLATRFWSERVAGLAKVSPLLTQVLLTQAVHLVGRYIYKSLESAPTRLSLIDYLENPEVETLPSFDDARANAALDALLSGKLLYSNVEQHEVLGQVEKLRVRFEIFWQWVIARHLAAEPDVKRGDIAASELLLDTWLQHTDTASVGSEGVLEYLLLLLDGECQRNTQKEQFTRKLWTLVARGERLSPAAAWFGGPKASTPIQKALARITEEYTTTLPKRGRRDLFAFMHFLNEVKPDCIANVARLQLLQPHFRAIHESSLTDYYLYLVQRRFDTLRNTDELLGYMFCFEGCEVMEVAYDLAHVTANALDRFGDDDAFSAIIKYLQILGNRQDIPVRDAPWQRYFYREWLLREYCSRLTSAMGLLALDFLLESFWYNPDRLKIKRPLPREMEQEANIALGYCYRTTWDSDERSHFEDRIQQLVDGGNRHERMLAFHLIRHTVPANPHARVHIGFQPMLRELFHDEGLRDLHARFRDFFANNLRKRDLRRATGR
jgi:hypothetical protein